MKKHWLTFALAGLLTIASAAGASYLMPQLFATAEAATAADHPLTNLQAGSTTSIAELYSEKPLFLNFWASWCPPCIAEMPHINSVYASYGDRVNFAVVSVDNTTGDALAFIEGRGADLSLPFYYGDVNAIAESYRLDAIPQSFMISRDGTILAHHVGGMTEAQLREFIESAL